ncbi:hypothetical protein SLNSH_10445 [Alsobacter soli]|uniref:Flagellin N-terminal domain-containing protein n=1 Tax=Alsobacter soli TaxID=2109933 RepID=A0A2T1HUA4_9HYPH|nr:hypothetical protein [Alsobacter soli]PSC05221.1 hypothetical protein SLNSH_10445 [Alsobacter soli]
MPTPISGQMRASLLAVTSLNDDITTAQTRLNTGRKVNTALDDPATYFKAQNLTSRASALDLVNQNIALTMSNVKTADSAMSTMLKNMNAQLSAMKDARSVPVGANAAAVNVTGKVIWASLTDSMVDTAANISNANKFQDQDVLSFTITDSSGVAQTRYFKAVSAAPVNTTTDGSSAANAFQFNTVQDLRDQLKAAFGTATITTNGMAAGGGFKLQLVDPTKTLKIEQTGNAGAAANNVFADLTSIFGAPMTTSVLGTGNSNMYAPTPATANQDALDTRRSLADGYITMLNQLDALVKDAFVPGLTNLLTDNTNGNIVNLSPDGSTKQKIVLSQKLDPASLGFNWNGTTSTDIGANFNNDGVMDAAIGKMTTAIQAVTRLQKSLANQSSMLNNRTEFNKALVANLNGGADLLTAADATAEAANLAALQTRQSFATNNMASTKQAESGLIQLLR